MLTATDDRNLNRKITEACKIRNILVNTADDKSRCDFYFPAVTEKDGVVIGMNSSGKNPKAVREVREYLEVKIRNMIKSMKLLNFGIRKDSL